MALIRLLISIVLALFPERYRYRLGYAIGVDAHRGALVGGIIECSACGLIYCFRYIYFLNERVGRFAEQIIGQGSEGAMANPNVQFGAGMVSLAEYVIHPVSLLLLYFTFEGLVRWVSALVHDEIVPTLPLQLIEWAHHGIATAKHERDLGPAIEDLVQPGSGDFALVIASCRPKPWTKMTTISYDDKLYELSHEESAQPPRTWVYVLRRRPESKIVRGAVYHYHPDELLPIEEQAAAAGDPA
jgi:hypothetical protein